MQRVKTGTLVMWNVHNSVDYGCMGLVISTFDLDSDDTDEGLLQYFDVQWIDDSLVQYDQEEIIAGNIKVVKF